MLLIGLVLEDGLIECCDKYSNIGITGWYDGLMQVGVLDASREGRLK